MKPCSKCGEEKPLAEFSKRARNPDGRQAWCKVCYAADRRRRYASNGRAHIERARAWNIKNPDRQLKNTLKRKYDLSIEQFQAMVRGQSSRCAICGEETKLVVDHCHQTMRVRGLLCHKCNVAIGLLRDNPDLMQSAARYILGAR
jgi:hypothetical protein